MSTKLEQNIEAIKLDKDTNLLPSNLKKGVTCLGVVGTYEGTPVSSGVKLFDTVAHMQADVNKQEGDLAVVYVAGNDSPITETTEFSGCTFPNTVVLPSAFSGSVWGEFMPVGSGWAQCRLNFSSSMFRFEMFGDSTNINITYSSGDGVTYTRTDGGEEFVDFGMTIKWDYGDFNDNIGYFMRIGEPPEYSGLFECLDGLTYTLAETQLDATNEYVFNKTFYGNNGTEVGTMQNVTDLNRNDLYARCEVYSTLSTIDINFSSMNNSCYGLFQGKSYRYIPEFNTYTVTNMCNMFYGCSSLISMRNLNTSNVTDMCGMMGGCGSLTSVPNFDTTKVTDMSKMFVYCGSLINVPEYVTTNVTNMEGMFTGCSNLSSESYANITNMLPLASNITNITLLNIGLNICNFTNEQRNVLFGKGYIDAEVITGNVSTEYTIEYT